MTALELRLAALDRMIAAESGSKGAVEVGLHLSKLMKDLKVYSLIDRGRLIFFKLVVFTLSSFMMSLIVIT